MTDDLIDISTGLGHLLTRIEPTGYELIDCSQVTAGASQQTFKITVRSENGELIRYALRREQPEQINRNAGQLTAALEARLLKLARSNGVLVPEVLAELEPSDGLGQGYMMAWLEGETLGQRIVKRPEFEAVRQNLAFECGRELAKIHAIPVDQSLAAALNTVCSPLGSTTVKPNPEGKDSHGSTVHTKQSINVTCMQCSRQTSRVDTYANQQNHK